MNLYRFAGDSIHLMSFIGLIWHILRTRSSSSLSSRTQFLLALTFITRYTDLFTVYYSLYNTVFKVIFILATLALIFLIEFAYKSSTDRGHDKLRVEILILGSMFFTFVCWRIYPHAGVQEHFWRFSVFMEAFAILPQLYLVLKKGEADRCVGYYVAALWCYRSFYMMNWYYRYITEGYYDYMAIAGGILQLVIYSQFLCLPIKYGSNKTKQNESKLYVITPDLYPTQEKVGLHEAYNEKGISEKILLA